MLVDDEPTDDRPDGRTTASGCPERAGTAGEDTAAGVVPEAPGKVDGTGEAAAAAWEALELEVVDVTGARPAEVTCEVVADALAGRGVETLVLRSIISLP